MPARFTALIEDWVDDIRSFATGSRGSRATRKLAKSPVAGLLLLLLCAAVYLPGLWSIPPVDRDESRFAQASRQMFESAALDESAQDPALHSGGLAVPMVQDRVRLNKPPLIYWLQSGSAATLTGGDPYADSIWMYRVPSVLAATIAVLLTWRLGVSMFDPRAGLLAGVLLAVCPMVVWDAHQARADQVLLACTVASQLLLWSIWSRREKQATRADLVRAVLFWGAMGLGIMTKGPVTPMVALLTAVVLCLAERRWGWLKRTRPVVGLIVLAVLVLPWVIAVARHVGFSEYLAIVRDETLGRSAEAKEGHWGPPGYHLVLLPVLFFPGSFVTGVAVTYAIKRALRPKHAQAPVLEKQDENPPADVSADAHVEVETVVIEEVDDPDAFEEPRAPGLLKRIGRRLRDLRDARAARQSELFLLAWLLPAWIVFELVSTKLPHYTMPLYPAVALLSARGLLAAAAGSIPDVDTGGARLGFGVWLGIGFAICCVAPPGLALLGAPAWVFAVSLLVAGGSGYLLFRAHKMIPVGKLVHAQLFAAFATTIALATVVGLVLPNAKALWNSPRLLEAAEAAAPAGDEPVKIGAAGYHEDSLVFLTRGRLRKIDDPEAWARRERDSVLIAPAGTATSLLSDNAINAKLIESVKGFNYSRGSFETNEVIRID